MDTCIRQVVEPMPRWSDAAGSDITKLAMAMLTTLQITFADQAA